MANTFLDRHDAGRQLAERLKAHRRWEDPVVLGLPRGGVPVAYEVALGLDAPLDVFLVRKLGVPGHEELAMGAIASGGVRVLNEDVIAAGDIPQVAIELVSRAEDQELQRRERAYRGDRAPVPLAGRSVIVVDDGIATGASMRAAVAALRQQHPSRLAIGVPVGAVPACMELGALVDDIVCVRTPEPFAAVGIWYRDFREVSDDEVRTLLARADDRPGRHVA